MSHTRWFDTAGGPWCFSLLLPLQLRSCLQWSVVLDLPSAKSSYASLQTPFSFRSGFYAVFLLLSIYHFYDPWPSSTYPVAPIASLPSSVLLKAPMTILNSIATADAVFVAKRFTRCIFIGCLLFFSYSWSISPYPTSTCSFSADAFTIQIKTVNIQFMRHRRFGFDTK